MRSQSPEDGVPGRGKRGWGKEEQGSEGNFRRQAEVTMSGLCDDAADAVRRSG